MLKKTRFVKQYLFFSLLSLLTPLVMGVMMYLLTYNLEYKRVEKENVFQLEQKMGLLDQALIEADRLSLQLLSDIDINALTLKDNLFDSSEIYEAAKYLWSNRLIPRALLNPLFSEYFIISLDKQYIFSQKLISPLSSFYTYDFTMKDVAYEDWLNILNNLDHNGFHPDVRLTDALNTQVEYIPYFYAYQDSKNHKKVVMVLIKTSEIQKLFARSNKSEAETSMQLLYRDTPVFDTMETDPLAEGYRATRFKSGMKRYKDQYVTFAYYQNWSCFTSQSIDSFSANIQYIPKLTLLVIIAILLLSLVFLLFLAYRTSRPILHILEKLRHEKENDEGKEDVLFTLDFFVEQLKGRNHELEIQIEEQQNKLKTNLLASLLYDTIPNPMQIPTLARHAGLHISPGIFVTAVVHLKGSNTHLQKEWEERFPVSLVSLQNKVYQAFAAKAHLIQTSLNELCVIAVLPEEHRQQERDVLVSILARWVKEELQEVYVIGVSQYHQGLESVGRSFREARSALVYNWPDNDDTIHYYQKGNITKGENDLYFPREMDHVILDAIRAGHGRELKECLLRIRRENLELRKLEPFSQNMLISRYKEIIANSTINLEIHDDSLRKELETILGEPTGGLSVFLTQAEQALIKLCDYCLSGKTMTEIKTAERVKAYIEANFQDNQLSLIMTAEHLGLSSQYLTHLIKKYYGKTFRAYMEDLRLENVRQLIISSEIPIHQLIVSGGYNSMNTFCKAFKRKYGYSASSLRE